MKAPVNTPRTQLLVISSAAWVARDLASAGTIRVDGAMGLDAPALDGTTALWCSGAWAMRLMASGTSHPFLSAGPAWLTTVPEQFLGRRVLAGRLEELEAHDPGPGFYKLAEHKHSGIPAAIHRDGRDFRGTVEAAFNGAPVPALGQLSYNWSEPMGFTDEYRCFIAGGKVTAASFYRRICGDGAEITWDAFRSSSDRGYPAERTAEAAAFAQDVADAMGPDQPPGYTLDVGTCVDGPFLVIEANAAWSSNIYHANSAGVIASVLSAQDPSGQRWLWQPDRLFLDRARPLPSAPPASVGHR